MSEIPLVRCNFGMRGYGKSTLARAMVRARPRLLVCDPMIEHEALALEIGEFESYIDQNPLERFRVAMTTQGAETYFCAIAWEIGTRIGRPNDVSLSVLLEEADLVARPGQEPWILKRLAAQGRHHGIELIACSRRPAEVSRYLTSLAGELNVFRTQEPRDLIYLRGFLPREAVEQVNEFDRFEFIRWTPNSWEKRVLNPDGSSQATTSRRESEDKKIVDERAGAV